MTDWKTRLRTKLEPILLTPDPRPALSAYHDMPFAIFVYPPEDEFALRKEIGLLQTRLEAAGKRVTITSLAECLREACEAQGMTPDVFAEYEPASGLDAAVDSVLEALASGNRLTALVAASVADDAAPTRDVVLLTRAGALFPVYRPSSLLDQLMGQISVPVVLFYPGEVDGPAGLRFMGKAEADHNYRPRIF